jgi:glycosyltransferase involved in cell wall biosynthesis
MKILLVNWMDMANPLAGGAEVHLTELFRRFVKRGDEVTLIVSGTKDLAVTDEYEGIKIIRVGSRNSFNFIAPFAIRKLVKKENFDLIVEDINKVPLFLPLFVKTPVYVTVPHLFGSAIYTETNFILGTYVFGMEQPIPLVYKNSMIEVISQSTADDLEGRGVAKDKLRVVHCGMEQETYTFDPEIKKFDTPTLLYVGRIKKYKSVQVVIRTLKEVIKTIPDARLVVVGSGDYLDNLKELAISLGLEDRVEFTGFISMEEKVNWLRRSHVIVNPSPKEGWGLTNIEANACGTTVVAADSDGLRDSVKDGKTGILVPYGDPVKGAEKVVEILQNSELRSELEKNGLEWAQSLTWDGAAEQTMKNVDEFVASFKSN